MGQGQGCTGFEERDLVKAAQDSLDQTWRARHPESGQLLRARRVRPTDVMSRSEWELFDEELKSKVIFLAWQRYLWKERPARISHPPNPFKISACMRDILPINKYLSFVQTVGLPRHNFELGDIVECSDRSQQWRRAEIVSRERDFYQIRYRGADKETRSATEWLSSNSARLRYARVMTSVGDTKEAKGWNTISVQDHVEARYPVDQTWRSARVVAKSFGAPPLVPDRGGGGGVNGAMRRGFVVVQYEDSSLLTSQRVIYESEFGTEIRDFASGAKRWDETRKRVYGRALESIGLHVHEVSKDGGHSMYRSLSHQVFGTPTNFRALRIKCLQHIVKHKAYYQHFVDCEFERYVAHQRRGAADCVGDFFCPGDHLSLQAIAEMYDASVVVYSSLSERPLDELVFYPKAFPRFSKLPTVVLSYAGNDEYDSCVSVKTGVPVVVRTNVGRLKPLHLMEKDNRQLVLRARQAEFRRMCELHATGPLQGEPIAPGNPFRAYRELYAASRRQRVFTAVRARCYESLPARDFDTRGKAMYQALRTAGLDLRGDKPVDFGAKFLGPLAANGGAPQGPRPAWTKRIVDIHGGRDIVVEFCAPSVGLTKDEKGISATETSAVRSVVGPVSSAASGFVLEIRVRGESRAVEELVAALHKLLRVRFEQRRVVAVGRVGRVGTKGKSKAEARLRRDSEAKPEKSVRVG